MIRFVDACGKNLLLLVGFTILFHVTSFQKCIAQATAISGGAAFSLFVCNGNYPLSCGINGFGQLGNGTTANSLEPEPVNTLTGIIAVSAGENHSLFLKNDSTVWASGFNAQGQLGNGTIASTYSNAPMQVNIVSGITAIAAGGRHSLFLKNNGTVWACGDNEYGQLGDGSNTSTLNSPPFPAGIQNVTAIAAGSNHSLFLKSDSTVWACGVNLDGQLGNGGSSSSNTPVQTSNLTGITAMAAGLFHSLFLKSDSTVWACGYNAKGQLGDGTNSTHLTPFRIAALSGIIAIAAGREYSLFLKSDGTVWSCGDNFNGQLGNNSNTDSNIPVQVADLSAVSAIAAGEDHSIFLKSDGTVWACGNNNSGQLGDGSTTQHTKAIQVTAICDPSAINEIVSTGTLLVYPNPASQILHIASTRELAEGTIEIANSLGMCIAKLPLHSGEASIHLNGPSKGIYFFRLMKDNKILDSGKFVVE